MSYERQLLQIFSKFDQPRELKSKIPTFNICLSIGILEDRDHQYLKYSISDHLALKTCEESCGW